jgi:1-phosphatidylinositol phosphodiesterase
MSLGPLPSTPKPSSNVGEDARDRRQAVATSTSSPSVGEAARDRRTAPKAVDTSLVKRGSTGPQVSKLQQELKAAGIDPGPVDGIFGAKTEKAVKQYQAREKLGVDGRVGNQTWKALTTDRFEPGTRSSGTAAAGSASPAPAATKVSEGLIPASQANPATWMSQSVSKSTSLANLTLPGTHDSAATDNLGLPGSADAQKMSLKEQLNSGVRFLDLRFKLEPATHDRLGRQLTPEHLQVYHGIARQPLSAEEALKTTSDFLRDHPGEAVVVSIKNEGATGGADDARFQGAVEGLMSKLDAQHAPAGTIDRNAGATGSLFYQDKNKVPTLGEAQGKMVLVRRYAAPDAGTKAPLGIDATSGWPDGTSHATGVTGNKLLDLEDHYNNFDGAGTNQQEKWRDVQQALDRAATHSDPGALHLTFSSATNTSPFTNPTWNAIPSFSDPINRQLIDYAHQHRAGVGVVAVDRANPDLLRALINMNG